MEPDFWDTPRGMQQEAYDNFIKEQMFEENERKREYAD